jgi:hypothetical protein
MISGRFFFQTWFPGRRRRGEERGAAGTLDARVHVGLVVEADIEHVVPALHRPGKGLEADVHRPAVAADGD